MVNSRELTLEMADFRLEAEDAGQSAGLVGRARGGDLEAFDQIMQLHQKQVLSTAVRLLGNLEDAQDAAQEAFLRLYRNLHKVEDGREIQNWLYRVTVNLCNDQFRKRRLRHATPLGDAADPVSGAMDPESSALHLERARLVEMALA